MGDISAEPSMEDILSSIKRIIAEDGETHGARPRRPARTAAVPEPGFSEAGLTIPDDGESTVLELSDPAPDASELAESAPPEPALAAQPSLAVSAPAPIPAIVSRDAAAASRGSLDALTRMITRPEPEAAAVGAPRSMEAFVADLLRPMLREWLDAHLPELVEAMVAKEIARITGNR